MPTSSGPNESFASLFEQSPGSRASHRRFRVGESVEVVIVAIAREAVFAELGGKQEGVFEKAALSDAEGKLRVQLGSKISAVVASIDASTGQVRLAPVVIRAQEGDIGVAHSASTGGAAGPVLVEGARVKGKVTGIERYGVFVQISGTQGRSGRGLVPTPETGTPRGADLKKHFSVGQEVETKILAIDETGKIRLSIAALGADDERGLFEAYKSGGKPEAAEGKPEGKPAPKGKPDPRNFGTLGDLLPKIAPKPAAAKPAPAKKADTPAKRTNKR